MHLLIASSLHQPLKSSPILPEIQGNSSVLVPYEQKNETQINRMLFQDKGKLDVN
jgi:hypothetical protein